CHCGDAYSKSRKKDALFGNSWGHFLHGGPVDILCDQYRFRSRYCNIFGAMLLFSIYDTFLLQKHGAKENRCPKREVITDYRKEAWITKQMDIVNDLKQSGL